MYVIHHGGKWTLQPPAPAPAPAAPGPQGGSEHHGQGATEEGDHAEDGEEGPQGYDMFHPDNPLWGLESGGGGSRHRHAGQQEQEQQAQAHPPRPAAGPRSKSYNNVLGAGPALGAALPHPEHTWLASVTSFHNPVVARVGNADLVVRRPVAPSGGLCVVCCVCMWPGCVCGLFVCGLAEWMVGWVWASSVCVTLAYECMGRQRACLSWLGVGVGVCLPCQCPSSHGPCS